jgi:hypothetical protein
VVIASEKVRESILGSLAAVGSGKSLGYLPLATVRNHLDLDEDEIVGSFERRGLKAKTFQAHECCIKSGAIYVFDPVSLQKVLDAASDTLKGSSWPVVAESFVNRIAEVWVDPSHPVYAVIRRAFGEEQ